jgi:predicted regulator of Ras-like GTPase activity (Roadblock/LC7/MglB family)
MKQKTSTNQIPQLVDVTPIISSGEESIVFANLASILAEVRKLKGVKGYIMRSKTAAIVDLTEDGALSEYAMLASQICECTPGMVKQFNLTDVESIIVEGKTVKALCINIGENRISVFMDKTCSHTWIVKRILL